MLINKFHPTFPKITRELLVWLSLSTSWRTFAQISLLIRLPGYQLLTIVDLTQTVARFDFREGLTSHVAHLRHLGSPFQLQFCILPILLQPKWKCHNYTMRWMPRQYSPSGIVIVPELHPTSWHVPYFFITKCDRRQISAAWVICAHLELSDIVLIELINQFGSVTIQKSFS